MINLGRFTPLLFVFCANVVIGSSLDKEVIESLRCSRVFSHFEKKYQIPVDTIHSIALKESGKIHSEHKIKIVWPWSANVEGQSYYFSNKKEAVTFVKQQLKSGKNSIDVGCMQINLKHHPTAFKSIEHAFDPKININYGASFLRLKYDNLQDWHKAIAHYHSATPNLGSKYKQDVINIASKMPEYKSDLRKYTYQNYKNQSSSDNLNRAQYNNFLSSRPKYTKYIQTVSAANNSKISGKNYNRLRSNMMVHVPHNNKASKYKT